MNHKIAAYIEHQRNAPLFTSVNNESTPIQKAGKAGQEFEHDMLESMNNDGLFDESDSFKLFVVLSVLFNIGFVLYLISGVFK